MPSWQYSMQETDIPQGTTLFLFTDGLTEAMDINYEQFQMDRVMEVAQQALAQRQLEPKQIISMMTEAVHQFVGDAEQSDDLTMMAIQYNKPQCTFKMQKSITLNNDIQEVPQLTDFVNEVCKSVELDKNTTSQITVAIEEAVVNVMNYAYPAGTQGKVKIEATANDERLKFTISDSGTPFDPTAQAEADITLPANKRSIGGLGIHIVRQTMDTVDYERTGDRNVLTLRKKLNNHS